MPELLLGGIVDLHHAPYAQAIAAAGGVPVQLPREAEPREVVRRLDALIIAGGDDIDPRLYGACPGSHTMPLDPERDAFELQLIDTALELDMPLLGICRGCQLLNVARGGTLIEHLSLDAGESHGQLVYPLHARVHGLDMPAGEVLTGLLPADIRVNSFHHQAVAEPGEGVVPIAYAADGVCEAIRVGTRALGVQWHPEYLKEQPDPVFLWLVAEARKQREPTASNERVDVAATSGLRQMA
jgi:putative glutamine amidotransferase